MNKIVLINCYFGKYPSYFELFLNSCKKNPEIDFFLYTDNDLEVDADNVRIIKTTFDEIKKRIQNKFDFEITLNATYKLCDYKPAYGYIFEEDICEYEFWGYCDIDMIFGDIKHFITEDLLENYDKFYKLGHLTIFRQSKDMNRLFMVDNTYKKSFTTDVITVFDEADGIDKIFEKENKKNFFRRDYADITPKKYRFTLSDMLFDSEGKNNYKYQMFTYEDGKVYRYYMVDGAIDRQEFIYIHIQKRKLQINCTNKERFIVSNTGFWDIPETKWNVDIFVQYNGFELKKEIVAKLKHLQWRVNRKLNKMRQK